MAIHTKILSELVDLGGSALREVLGDDGQYKSYILKELSRFGLIETTISITEKGRKYLEKHPIKIIEPDMNFRLLEEAWKFPLASTDEEIKKIEKAALEARNFE